MYEAFLLDLETARQKGWITEADFKSTYREAARIRRLFTLQREFLASGIFAKFRILFQLKRAGLDRAQLKSLNRRFVPRPLLLRIQLARSYAALGSNRSL